MEEDVMPMEYAVTLPQGGRAASPDSIHRVAALAEELGYSHLWVNDHITSPKDQQSHVSPFMFDPLMAIANAAALTSQIGLGIQLTVPYYEPLWLANALASLDVLSGGRVTISVGVGWSQAEFDALSSSFTDRGARADEILAILRTAWSEDYVPINTPHYHLPPVKIAPKPAHPIAIWGSGTSERAYRRAVELCDGFHGHYDVDITAKNAEEKVERIRRDRPEESFTFSLYTWAWDLGARDEKEVLEERDAFEAAGIQHIVIALSGPQLDGQLQTVQRLAEILEIKPR
jgi:probable F420-dependent oxidoreductase